MVGLAISSAPVKRVIPDSVKRMPKWGKFTVAGEIHRRIAAGRSSQRIYSVNAPRRNALPFKSAKRAKCDAFSLDLRLRLERGG